MPRILEDSPPDRLARLRPLLPAIYLCGCVLILLKWLIGAFFLNWLPDYTVFWTAARLAIANPDLVYDELAVTIAQGWIIELRTGIRPWAYPPTAILPLLPFSMLPFAWSFATFTLLTAFAYAAASRRMLEERWVLGLALILMSDPFLFAAANGQMTLLIGALTIGGLARLPDRPALAGVLIGIAAALKPQLLILLPLALLAARQYQALFSAAAAGAAILLLTIPLGISLWFEWFNALPRFLEIVAELDIMHRNITPTGVLWNLGIEGPARVAASIAFAGIGAVVVWKVFSREDDPARRLVGLIGGGLCCSPYAMNYELTLLLPGAVIFLLRGARGEGSIALMLASGSLLLVDEFWTPPVTLAFLILSLKDAIRWPAVKLSRTSVVP